MPRYSYNGVTVTATNRRSSTRDDKKYMRTVTIDGNDYLVHYGDPNLPMRRNNPERRKAFVTRHNCEAKKNPRSPGFWACYDWENTSEMTEATNFLFTELQELTRGKPFAGFAIGDFVDMYGREVKFEQDDYMDFATNTESAISAVKEKGQPGLPIDARKHDKGDAAGWIVGVELGEVKNSKGKAIPVLMLLAEWTKLGVELITEKIQTNFSPTVDLAKKVLRGGSLTNWPASVDENGIPIFAAIELSEGVRALRPVADKENEGASAPEKILDEVNSMTQEEMRDFIRAELQTALSAALAPAEGEDAKKGFDITGVLDLAETIEDIKAAHQQAALEQYELARQEAQRQAMLHVAKIRHEANVKELAQVVTSGNDDVPYGLPVNVSDLQEFLLRLEPADFEFVSGMLRKIQKNGRVVFTELGHGKQLQGTAELPKKYAEILRTALKGGLTIDDFFEMNVTELGDKGHYDLTAFVEVK